MTPMTPMTHTRTTHLLDLAVTLLLLKQAKLVTVTKEPESSGRNRYRFTLELLDPAASVLFEAWTASRDPRFVALTIPLSVANRLALGSRVAMQWLTSQTVHPHRDIVPEVWEAFTHTPCS